MPHTTFTCADCATEGCATGNGAYPDFCPTQRMTAADKDACVQQYRDGGFPLQVMQAASATSSRAFSEVLCRIEETLDFARRMGYRTIGIASCSAFSEEARTLAKILRIHGYQPYGAACKIGSIPKKSFEAQESCCEYGAVSCNPLLQAQTLNEAGTDFNIVLGLCVGHDTLFYRASQAPCTTLMVKDRALGNNPAAAFRAVRTVSPYARMLREDASLSAPSGTSPDASPSSTPSVSSLAADKPSALVGTAPDAAPSAAPSPE